MSAPRLWGTRNDSTLRNPHRILTMPIFGLARSLSPLTVLYLWFAASIFLALLLPNRSWYPRTTSLEALNSCNNVECCFLEPVLIPHPGQQSVG